MKTTIQTGKSNMEKALSNMANRQTELIEMSKDESNIASIAGTVQSRVVPSLSAQQRKTLENDYQSKLTQMRQATDEKQMHELRDAAEKDSDELREADRKDAHSTRDEFRQSRREAKDDVKQLARASHKALQTFPSAYHLEREEKENGASEHQYDRDEDSLEHEKDRYGDQIEHLEDKMYDTIEDIYDRVHDHLDATSRTKEHEDRSKRSELRQAEREAMQSLAKAALSSQDLSALVGTNNLFITLICATFIVGGLAVALRMHAKRRNINQPELFGYQA